MWRNGESTGSAATVAERSPRVLVVIQNLPLRIDRRVRSECRALIDAGYGVSVICPKEHAGEPDRHELDGVVVHSYPAPSGSRGLWSYLWEFLVCWVRTARLSRRVAAAEGFDVLQACNPPDTYWLLGALWRLRGRPYVFDQHDLCPEVYEARFGRRGVPFRVLLGLEALTYRVADRVVCPNPAYQAVALERGRVPLGRTAVVMSTPDAARMRRGAPCRELRRGRRHLVTYVGIMGPQDGVDRLLAAIDHFVHERGRTDTTFALLGFGDSLADLRADCTRRELDPWVTFTGRVDHDELGRWLSSADLGVTPDPPNEFNHRSTMNKTLEYMAHELATVATRLRETARCAADAAVYVPEGEPIAMAAAISDLLDDPAARERMGRIGRARIEGELAWSHQARAYVGVFDALLGDAPRRRAVRR
ncbi:glycosyltransferase family 4 protein [Pseudactinotalea sp. HY160]|uniref:glycosyltransferase family 4 protein n=1 Tax=Pseudactinotalea sp. HY160 TaxID=2654490 RepID=UPI00128B0E1E|nr:glycosyltransferase family 4 protein [Pseudactinotalea sp. HY160]